MRKTDTQLSLRYTKLTEPDTYQTILGFVSYYRSAGKRKTITSTGKLLPNTNFIVNLTIMKNTMTIPS